MQAPSPRSASRRAPPVYCASVRASGEDALLQNRAPAGQEGPPQRTAQVPIKPDIPQPRDSTPDDSGTAQAGHSSCDQTSGSAENSRRVASPTSRSLPRLRNNCLGSLSTLQCRKFLRRRLRVWCTPGVPDAVNGAAEWQRSQRRATVSKDAVDEVMAPRHRLDPIERGLVEPLGQSIERRSNDQ